MPLLQSATSVLRQTWGFKFVPVMRLVAHPGDLVFVQGSYHFTDMPPDGSGADMVRGRRRVNKVEITFVFDRNEVTSGSARTEWLLGVHTFG